MIRRPPRSTPLYSSAASDVYKRQDLRRSEAVPPRIVVLWAKSSTVIQASSSSAVAVDLVQPIGNSPKHGRTPYHSSPWNHGRGNNFFPRRPEDVAIDLSATNTQLLPPGRTWNVVKPLARWRCAARRASLAAHFLFI